MPLKKGKSKQAFQSNIKEVLGAFKETGKIGSSKPKSLAKAQKQAVAIAYSQQKKSPLSEPQKRRRLKALS